MTEKRSFIEMCQDEVNRTLSNQLKSMEQRILKVVTFGTISEAQDLLTEANSIINFICGEDTELYEQYRYRLFLKEDNQLFIIQAVEIDVENYPNEFYLNEE